MVNQIYIDELFELYNSKSEDHVFIDVREPEEWELGTIPNIKKIPMGEIKAHFDELDKNKKYVIVCRSGARSNVISQLMLGSGFSDVSNFAGGMLDWYDNDYAIE